jgi:hypothetical protein
MQLNLVMQEWSLNMSNTEDTVSGIDKIIVKILFSLKILILIILSLLLIPVFGIIVSISIIIELFNENSKFSVK